MPRFTREGFAPIETAVPREAAELRRDGWTEQKAKTSAVKEADAAKTESK
jgi:hypothetical protein